MTDQASDYIFTKGSWHKLSEYALQPLIERLRLSPGPEASDGISSNCWRGHIAIWTLKDERLFLLDVRDFLDMRKSVRWLADQPIESLFSIMGARFNNAEHEEPTDNLLEMDPADMSRTLRWLGGERDQPLEVKWLPDLDYLKPSYWRVAVKPIDVACFESNGWLPDQLGHAWLKRLSAAGFFEEIAL